MRVTIPIDFTGGLWFEHADDDTIRVGIRAPEADFGATPIEVTATVSVDDLVRAIHFHYPQRRPKPNPPAPLLGDQSS